MSRASRSAGLSPRVDQYLGDEYGVPATRLVAFGQTSEDGLARATDNLRKSADNGDWFLAVSRGTFDKVARCRFTVAGSGAINRADSPAVGRRTVHGFGEAGKFGAGLDGKRQWNRPARIPAPVPAFNVIAARDASGHRTGSKDTATNHDSFRPPDSVRPGKPRSIFPIDGTGRNGLNQSRDIGGADGRRRLIAADI